MFGFNDLEKKFEIGFNNLKNRNGSMNLLYSVSDGLVARVSKNEYPQDFATDLCIHEKRIAEKLVSKGYLIP